MERPYGGATTVTTLAKKLGLSAVSFILAAALAGTAWYLLRSRNRSDTLRKIQVIQRSLVALPEVGFLWKPNLNVRIAKSDLWLDCDLEGIEPVPLTTDRFGFRNPPDAIALLDRKTPDIIGLGDSFIHDANAVFFRTFEAEGLFYYNMAMQRHCPPQYNSILTRYALQHRPSQVLYGIYKNDFKETQDYLEWQRSGTDWFTFHSGYWCGAPASTREPEASRKKMYRAVFERVVEASERCRKNKIGFTLMLIPSKRYVVKGDRSSYYETQGYDRMRRDAGKKGIRVVDVREVYAPEADKKGLYWKGDGHWSYRGMELAARSFGRKIAGVRQQ